jgi:hypothetical protein
MSRPDTQVGQRPSNPVFVQARTARRARALGALGALGLLASSAAGVAQAATTATATATFSTPGQYSFVVPPGVRSVTVIAIGAAGGGCPGFLGAGGSGAALTATAPVVPDETLFVGVGGPGAPCGDSSGSYSPGGAGGSGGGGAGTKGEEVGGGGGGGASLVGLASSPSASFGPQLLVVAGGGGGGGQDATGGGAGSAGETPGGADSGAGGGAGTSTAGGNGGAGLNGTNGAAGSFGIGGSGGPCSQLPSGGGGGGGGYFGGGGGGCGDVSGGGGGGSSFAVRGAANVSIAASSAEPSVAITYAAPTADETTTRMQFGVQAPGIAGPAQTLTVTNNGSAPLVVSGVLLGGADPEDFLVGDRCQQPVAVGSSCQVGVRFHPQMSGARSATLTLLTNAASAPQPVALAGGVSSRARGPASKVELLTCKPAGEGLIQHEHGETPPAAGTCTGKRVRGAVKFTATGAATRARLVRGRLIFATGASVATARGGSELVLTERRPLTRGTYTLILRRRHGGHPITQRLPIILRSTRTR